MKKKILVTIHQPPYGGLFFSEGLRAAVGISSGFDEHPVDLLFLGEGVYCGLRGVDYKDLERFFKQLKSIHTQFYVEEEALIERGLSSADVSPDFKTVNRREIIDRLKEYDINLDY